jgi:hypothetical protein
MPTLYEFLWAGHVVGAVDEKYWVLVKNKHLYYTMLPHFLLSKI